MFTIKEEEYPRILILCHDKSSIRDYQNILKPPQKVTLLKEIIYKIFRKENGENQSTYEIDFDNSEEGILRKLSRAEYALIIIDLPSELTVTSGTSKWSPLELMQNIWKIHSNTQIIFLATQLEKSTNEAQNKFGFSSKWFVLQKPTTPSLLKQLTLALVEKWQIENLLKKERKVIEHLFKDRINELEKIVFLMRSTLESKADGILVINNTGKIVGYNQKFLELWKIPSEILEQQDMDNQILQLISNQLETPEEIIKKLKSTKSIYKESFEEIKLKDNRVLECYSFPHQIHNEAIGTTWSFRDITENKLLQDELLHQATYDILTNLPNRALFLDRLQQAMSLARRNQTPVPVFFVDIDHFKSVNDTYGHEAGDELLKKIASRFMECLRAVDTVSRFGGDEFVITLSSVKNLAEVTQIADKLLMSLNPPFDIQGKELKATGSMGISIFPQDGEETDVLLKNADTAMYHAKQTGRNQYQFYNENLNANPNQ